MARIASFKAEARYDFGIGRFLWQLAKEDVCQQFDTWRKAENPKILSIDFGRIKSGSLSGSNSEYIRVLYDA